MAVKPAIMSTRMGCRSMTDGWLTLAAMAGLAVAVTRKSAPLVSEGADTIATMAADVVRRHGWEGRVSPCMIRAMVEIESGGNPLAIRPEISIGDVSVGLMQTLVGTARWLWQDMGYRAYPKPDAASLLDGATSIYFGGAYIHYLSRYGRKARSEHWIVESYNGGPGQTNAQTRHHLAKYLTAKQRIGC